MTETTHARAGVDATRPQYLLDSLSDRDRLYLMFDVLHAAFERDFSRALAIAGLPNDPAKATFRLLDVCCGEGLHVAELAQKYPRATFIGFDCDVEAIETAKSAYQRLPNLSFVNHDAEAPLPPSVQGPFDLVQIRFGLTHMRDTTSIFARIHERMKPGGVIYLVDPRADVFQLDHPSMHFLNDGVIASWSAFGTKAAGERQVEILEKAGFEVVESVMDEHAASGPNTADYPMFKLMYETLRSMRKALVEVTHVVSANDFDTHLDRLGREIRPADKGHCRFQVSFGRKNS